jgi:hypothetical protein
MAEPDRQLRLDTGGDLLSYPVYQNSAWARSWPDAEQRRQWTHRLANLVPLNFRRNVQASNYDFDKKKSAYFGGKRQVSSFVLTTQVLNTPQWSHEHVQARQSELLDILFDKWELGDRVGAPSTASTAGAPDTMTVQN